jgi:hypothetical protein
MGIIIISKHAHGNNRTIFPGNENPPLDMSKRMTLLPRTQPPLGSPREGPTSLGYSLGEEQAFMGSATFNVLNYNLYTVSFKCVKVI